jgi:hypothetical protein
LSEGSSNECVGVGFHYRLFKKSVIKSDSVLRQELFKQTSYRLFSFSASFDKPIFRAAKQIYQGLSAALQTSSYHHIRARNAPHNSQDALALVTLAMSAHR